MTSGALRRADLQRHLAYTRPFGFWISTALVLLTGGLIAAVYVLNMQLILLGLAVGAVYFAACIRYPRFWIYTVTASQAFWFRSTSKGLSLLDIAMVGFYIGGLLAWLYWYVLVKKKPLIHNPGDGLLLAAFALSICNVAVAVANGVEIIAWAREYLVLVFILYYLPIREHIKDKRHIIILLLLFLGVALLLGADNVRKYLRATTDITYAFEILHSRTALNEMVFTASSLFMLTVLLHAKRWSTRIISLLLSIFFIGVLVATFSRGFWAAFVVGAFCMLFVLKRRQYIALSVYSLIAIAVTILGFITILGGQKGELALGVLEDRVESAINPGKTYSVQTRVYESNVVMDYIKEHPLAGYGFGAEYHAFDMVFFHHVDFRFIHNGYLFIVFKWGIPLALIFYCGLFYYCYQAFKLARRAVIPFNRILAVGAFCCLIASFVVNNTSNQMAVRDGVWILAMLLAMVSQARYHIERQQAEPALPQPVGGH